MHQSDENLIKLKSGKLTGSEKLSTAEHIAQCQYCADRFFTLCESDIIPLAQSEKHKLLKKAKLYHPINRKHREFRNYCIKTCIACVCAIAMVAFFKTSKFSLAIKIPDGKVTKEHFNEKLDNMKEFFTFKENFNNEKTK